MNDVVSPPAPNRPAEAAPPPYLVSDLFDFLATYLPPEQVREIYRAYLFSAEAHEGQRRRSGEPYIIHPLAVARILGAMRMDYKCLIAAILHDVIEDTPIDKEQIAADFDDEVAELVDGVSKLSQIDFESRAEAQAASLQKMLLAMTRDIRVILIKLADRLHNMRTLGVMRSESRRRISRETLEIYAPIANRLGINSVCLELEELGFSHCWPWRHLVLERAVQKARGARQALLTNVETAIRCRLEQEEIPGEVKSRRKNLYSIYCKMRDKRRSFSEVVDVFGVRVTVDREDTCYRVLGQVHNLYKPVPGRFKDYIAIPKANGYQSLHTVLFGPQGVPLEIQIRTKAMQRNAESGIAAHWMYKSGGPNVASPTKLANDWLQDLLAIQRGDGSPQNFLDNVKVDLFPEEVYVFTPKGLILALKRGATAVDFAYAIHSDVGNTCVAVRIDRRLEALSTPLRSGQTVEIITAPGAKPNPAWLGFVVTGKARAGIRGFLKNLKTKEAGDLGRRLLNTELNALGSDLDQLPPARLIAYLEDAGLPENAALFVDIGLGNRLPALVARRLMGVEGDLSTTASEDATETHLHRFAIRGTEGVVVTFARCCRPIPGDAIAAVFNPGRGIVVHRQECRNLSSLESRRNKRLEVEWAAEPDGDFPVEIRVDIGNRRGTLAIVAGAIAELGCNIDHVRSEDKDGMNSALEFQIAVRGRHHLAQIIRRLRQIPLVTRIIRITR
jgi:RelA/SpoT family (p)ppGpp synthetase